jgi:hypothetical protein
LGSTLGSIFPYRMTSQDMTLRAIVDTPPTVPLDSAALEPDLRQVRHARQVHVHCPVMCTDGGVIELPTCVASQTSIEPESPSWAYVTEPEVA